MASVAEKKRRHKAATVARASEVKVERVAQPVGPVPTVVAVREEPIESGLAWLARKQRITYAQLRMGRDYAEWFRAAALTGAEPLASCLASDMPRGGGGGLGISPLLADTRAWIADCRAKLEEARAELNFETGMVAVLDLICGAGQKPREITTNQRETEQIETTLRNALSQLDAHFRPRK